MREDQVVARIWKHDHTVWKDDPTEITNRLGWLDSPEVMKSAIADIDAFVDDARDAGFTHVLLLGMGGSSLAPELFRLTFGVAGGYLDLSVLDSTDPGYVLEKDRSLDPAKTLYIVATKSGGTAETLSFMKYFYRRTVATVGKENAGQHFVAITDPGSKLESMAAEWNFRKTFLNDPNIGGRYSALSFFGLVPAALVGIDLSRLLEQANCMALNAGRDGTDAAGTDTSAFLGAAMGELALAGRDKVTLITSPPLAYFGGWAEQLIAESTGKEGKGILPVDGETVCPPDAYGDDRFFVYLKLKGDDTYDEAYQTLIDAGHPGITLQLNTLHDIGGEFLRWEMATIIASIALRINPFDQPNVESAKIVAREMIAAFQQSGKLPELDADFTESGITVYSDFEKRNLADTLDAFFEDVTLDGAASRSYVAIQAYVHPTSDVAASLQSLRDTIQKKFKVAVTAGFGPRFLHSTGQLHKGDGGHGLFLQLTADMPEDVPIPDNPATDDSSISFGILKEAQALGDRQALLDVNRLFLKLHLGTDQTGALSKIESLLS